jgi:hypothetical protein
VYILQEVFLPKFYAHSLFLLSITDACPGADPIQWVPGAFSLQVKRPGREADHSPPSSAEVKEYVELYLYSQYAFMAWCSVTAQGQLYLYLLDLKSGHRSKDVGLDGKITLEWMLGKYGGKV